MGRDIERRLNALEKDLPGVDWWNDYGDDGMRLAHLRIPNDDGSEDTTARPYTEAEAHRFGRLWLPDYDSRYQNPDGSPRSDRQN